MFKSKNAESKKEIEELRNASTSIGKGTSLVGTIEAYGNIRIEGNLKGDVKSKSKVVVGDSARIEGTIIAQNAEIEGEIKGRVEVSELLVLKNTAIILGDIVTNKLEVHSGATWNGNVKMGAIIKEINIGEPKFELAEGEGRKEKSA